MRIFTRFIALTILTLSTSFANDLLSNDRSDDVCRIRAFIASAPKPSSKIDLSYAIKIPDKERRIAVARCQEVLTLDKANFEAQRLFYKLQEGEGPQVAVANFLNSDEGWKEEGGRIFEVLGANLISFGAAGSRGVTVSVYESHEERARFLIAKLIMAEWQKSGLGKRDKREGGLSEGANEEAGMRKATYPILNPSLRELQRPRVRSVYPTEGLKILLTKRAEEGRRWVEVTPEEVIETYTE